jgi:hypothetical protein
MMINELYLEMSDEEWKERLAKRILFVIFNVISSIILKVLEKSSDGMTTSGLKS